jgi:RNA polymerase sigma-70 factor (ECF subfamily)
MSSKAVQQELTHYIPNMRAFAISLCRNVDLADDLVQEACLKAWRSLDTYQEGTNLRAWLFTILRNTFLSHLRKARFDLSLDDIDTGERLGKKPEQHGWMEKEDLLKALGQLSIQQREAIILVGAEGLSYEETAQICGCAIGTIKSRVNRARMRLHELLDRSVPLAA